MTALFPAPAPHAPTVEVSALNARTLTDMLHRHYQPDNKPPAGIFAPEIQSPDGSRRADLIWMPTTIAGGKGELHGHEIKCTRSDLLAELTDPTKADPWSQYCTRWWLVVSRPDLVTGLDIPDAWGILAPPSGRRTRSMTVIRPAPRLAPLDPAVGLARLAAWQMYATHDRIAELTRNLDFKDRQIAQQRDRIRELEAGGNRIRSEHTKRIDRILDLAASRQRDERLWFANLTDDELAAIIVDHQATQRAAHDLRRDLARIAEAVETLTVPLANSGKSLKAAARLAAGDRRINDDADGINALLAAFPEAEVMA